VAAHDARHIRAGRIEPGDRGATCAQHSGAPVGLQSGEGAEAAGHHLDDVERPLLDGCDTRVRLIARVPLVTIVERRAAAERRVLTLERMQVVLRHRSLQPLGINPGVPGQLSDSPPGFDVAGFDVRLDWERRRPRYPQPVSALEGACADQPRRDLPPGRDGSQHGVHIVVVTVALVAEAPPVSEDADDPWLPALDDVREAPGRAIRERHERDRAPGAGSCERIVHGAARGFSKSRSVAGRRGNRKRQMLLAGGKHAVTAFAVVRKAAGREHDASPRPHLRFSVRPSQHGATHGDSLL
jgi:hypothetical protein